MANWIKLGNWNALTNSPPLPTSPELAERAYYMVSVAGVFLGIPFSVGDWIYAADGSYKKIDNNDDFVSATQAPAKRGGIIGFTASGGGSVIPTGKVSGFFTCMYDGTIRGWNIMVDAGTATVKVWKIAAGTAKPTAANSINTSGLSISSGTAVRSSTMTDFTTVDVEEGDIFAFNIEAISGVTELSFALEITKKN